MSKSDLEELGESVDDLAQGFSKYAKEIKALTNFDIMADAAKGQFKDIYDIFEGISQVWDKLTDTQQARVSEILGGTRQLQVISSIINNWSDAANAYSTAMNSAGAATKANEIYMETAAAHIERFKAAFQELSRTLVDTGLVSTIVDFGAGVLSAIGSVASLISKLGGLKTILAAVGAYLLIAKAETIAFYIELAKEVILKRVIVLFDGIKSGFKSLIQIIPNAVTAWKNYAAGTAVAGATMEATIPVLGLVLAAVTAVIAGVSAANQAADEANQKAKEAADQAAASSKEISKLAVAYVSANDAYKSGSIDITKYNDAKNALIDKLVEEGGLVDQLTSKYNQNTEALNKNIEATLKKQGIDISAGKNAAFRELKSVTDGTVNYNPFSGIPMFDRLNPNHFVYSSGMSWGATSELEHELARAYKVLFEAGLANDQSIYDQLLQSGRVRGYQFVLDYDFNLDTVEGATAAYENLERVLSVLKDEHLDESDVFKQIYKQYDDLGEKLNKYNSYIVSSNENLVAQKMNNSLLGKDLPKTADEFEQLRDKIITATRASDEFIGSDEQLVNVVDEFLSTQPEFEEFYKETDSGATTVSSLESALQKSKEASKGLAESLSKTNANYSLLEKAQKEINENGGLSADTIKSLADANEDYLDYLYEENGQIKLNAKAWADFAGLQMRQQIAELTVAQDRLKVERDILQAKIDQMKAALASAASDDPLEQLRLLPQQAALAQMEQRVTELNEAITENQSVINLYQGIYDNLDSGAEKAIKATDDMVTSATNSLIALRRELNKPVTANMVSDALSEEERKVLEQVAKIRDAAKEFDRVANGNSDYFNRPFVKPETMRQKYPDFDGEIATTYFSTQTIGEGDNQYTIMVTPILPDGRVLSQSELDDYVDSLIVTNGTEGVLESDKLKLVVNIEAGEYDEEYWDAWIARTGDIKQKHWELVKELAEITGLSIDEAAVEIAKYGAMLDQTEADRTKNISEQIAEIEQKIKSYQSQLSPDNIDSYDRVTDSFASVAEALKGINDEFKSLAELQVAVADGFKMSQEEALKYAEVYPEILDGATLAANGEIQLNEDVVNNFIRGKRAELEASVQAKINELNAKRQMMLAVQQFAKTELEIAQGVANGEATISANVDQLRADNRNALTNALAEMGVQEVEQNKIASAAMAGNYTEVDRVTAEVASDMAKNLGTAASSAADDIQTNMYNARRDISAVAKQVGKTATAIRQMPRGVWKNEYGEIELGSRGGSGYTPIDTHVSSGSFNGISNGYDYVSVTLNNYIDDLTHQIDSYTDAINNIDGQIKLLESIKEHAFEIFEKQAREAAEKNKNGKSSGKDSSSSSKGDNWFEAQYKLYQHLLNMDAAETEDYLHWLEWAYQEAYNQGIITLDEYFKYQEEAFKGLRDLFKDYLSDLEHQISMRENFDGETDEILKIYEELLAAVTEEIHKAQEQGLDDNDDWLQELQDQWKQNTTYVLKERSKPI